MLTTEQRRQLIKRVSLAPHIPNSDIAAINAAFDAAEAVQPLTSDECDRIINFDDLAAATRARLPYSTPEARKQFMPLIEATEWLSDRLMRMDSARLAATPAPAAAPEAAVALRALSSPPAHDNLVWVKAQAGASALANYRNGQWICACSGEVVDFPIVGWWPYEAFGLAAAPEAGGMGGAELRQAAAPFAAHYREWMDEFPDDMESTSYPRHTFGQARALATALRALHATPTPAPGPGAAGEAGEAEHEGDGGLWALTRLYDYMSEAGHYKARTHIVAAANALGFFPDAWDDFNPDDHDTSFSMSEHAQEYWFGSKSGLLTPPTTGAAAAAPAAGGAS